MKSGAAADLTTFRFKLYLKRCLKCFKSDWFKSRKRFVKSMRRTEEIKHKCKKYSKLIISRSLRCFSCKTIELLHWTQFQMEDDTSCVWHRCALASERNVLKRWKRILPSFLAVTELYNQMHPLKQNILEKLRWNYQKRKHSNWEDLRSFLLGLFKNVSWDDDCSQQTE